MAERGQSSSRGKASAGIQGFHWQEGFLGSGKGGKREQELYQLLKTRVNGGSRRLGIKEVAKK